MDIKSFIIHAALLNLCVNAFDKTTFKELMGYRMQFNVIESFTVKNQIQCVRKCKNDPHCKPVNIISIGTSKECELNSRGFNRMSDLIEDSSSSFLCKLFDFLYKFG